MVSGCGVVLIRGRVLFVVMGVRYQCRLRLLSFVGGGTGYGSRCYGQHVCVGMVLLPVIPMYGRGSGDLVAIQHAGYSKVWLTGVLLLVCIYWHR